MKNESHRLYSIVLVAVASLYFGGAAIAEQGVTADQILIGSCSALDGPAKFLGTQQIIGAEAYFKQVNEEGRIHGRKIKLIARSDGYEPSKTIKCVNQLIKEDQVFSMGFFVGTPTGAKAAPMAQAKKIPLIGLFTGAEFLRNPVKKWVVNIRSSYFDETRAMVDNLHAAGKSRIAVFYQEDAFGKAVLKGVKLALKKHGKEPVALGTFKRNTMEIAAGLAKIAPSKPDAIVMVGTYTPLAKFVKTARGQGLNPVFLNVSFVGTEVFAQEVGSAGDGVVITQVVPAPNRTDLPAIAQYHELLSKYFPDESPNFVSLEGFIDAIVYTEALKRAGKDLTREGLIAAIEGMSNVDIGIGSPINFSPESHQGLSEIFSTKLQGGKAIVFNDWNTVLSTPASQ